MKKLSLLTILMIAQQLQGYAVDLINKSQFPIEVRVSQKKNYMNPPKQYVTDWHIGANDAKYNQMIGDLKQYTYPYLFLDFPVNYPGKVGMGGNVSMTYDIPKKFQNTNDFVVTIDFQKVYGKNATSVLDTQAASMSNEARSYLNDWKKQQKELWAWKPIVTFTGK
jgi:hypothetical protein